MADARDELADLRQRVDSAQQLAGMGDFDWHVPSDTNTWSDNLFRIFGYEPQSRAMDYPTYMKHCHPEDSAYVTGVHEHTFATGEPFTFTHRIVRVDGAVRHLLCRGEMIADDAGQVERLRGTSVDITERVLAEQEREHQAARVHEERMRRRAALEINDNVVQGLTAAIYALEIEDEVAAQAHLRRTLSSAQQVITDLGRPAEGDDLAPGDLVRTSASPGISADNSPGPVPAMP
jgi:PAS domain S-box-containing protein